jgi:hypothetical protein
MNLNTYFEAVATQWFFIRYWHGGPHIRVRFVDNIEGSIRSNVLSIMESIIPEIDKIQVVEAKDYYKNQTFDGEKVNMDDLPWYEQGAIIETEYIPEIERYGDGEFLKKSETIFQYSSELISEWLREHRSFNARILFSFYIFKNLLENCDGVAEQESFLIRYNRYWKSLDNMQSLKLNLSQIQSYLDPMEKAIKDSPISGKLQFINELLQELKATLENKDMFLYLLSSHIHMTNNRLSITPGIEAEIAATFVPLEEMVS